MYLSGKPKQQIIMLRVRVLSLLRGTTNGSHQTSPGYSHARRAHAAYPQPPRLPWALSSVGVWLCTSHFSPVIQGIAWQAPLFVIESKVFEQLLVWTMCEYDLVKSAVAVSLSLSDPRKVR